MAYALVRGADPEFYVADDLDVLHRVIALNVVAQVPAARYGGRAEQVRQALLEERWADAVAAWMDVTGDVIDVDEAIPVYTTEDVAGNASAMQLQFTPLFED